jgi:hypothetical protein
MLTRYMGKGDSVRINDAIVTFDGYGNKKARLQIAAADESRVRVSPSRATPVTSPTARYLFAGDGDAVVIDVYTLIDAGVPLTQAGSDMRLVGETILPVGVVSSKDFLKIKEYL